MNLRTTIAAAAVGLLLPTLAQAAVLFENPANRQSGNCLFNTACAAALEPGKNIIAAQKFTLSSRSTITSAAFTQLDFGLQNSSITWQILTAGPRSDLPKRVLASGTSLIGSTAVIGSLLDMTIREMFFDIPDLVLRAGDYYLSLQQVSDTSFGFLATGLSQELDAAQTNNGGRRWQDGYGYGSARSLAATVFGDQVSSAAPEPSIWALMGIGFLCAGYGLRRTQAVRAISRGRLVQTSS